MHITEPLETKKITTQCEYSIGTEFVGMRFKCNR